MSRMVRCPMYDWAQEAPTHAAAVALLSRHLHGSHTTSPAPSWLLSRSDARLSELGVTYEPPDGTWMGPQT